jgi:sulfatase modifying factor 1
VPYSGGNGGSHSGQAATSSGVTDLTATLSAGTFASGNGSLVYIITGIPSGSGTASFMLNIGGRSCTLTLPVNSASGNTGITMKNIPAGTFPMGCTSGDTECDGAERPVRNVTLSAFQMGETEVTQAQWQAVMGSNPSSFLGCATCPVEQVSWLDAVVFCNRLSEAQGLKPCYYSDAGFTQVYGKSGSSWTLPNAGTVVRDPSAKGYRLPTEAEWEYAARGGNNSHIYSGGNTVGNVAWYTANSSSKTQPVKGKQANGYGLYDMSGNVWEWCQDWYGSYPASAQTNPTGPTLASYRVLRGGGWNRDAQGCRASRRDYSSPSFRLFNLGFRLAL